MTVSLLLALIANAAVTSIFATDEPRNVMPPIQFNVDDRLQKNVDFWVKIYTHYDSHQGLVHDAKYIDHIYEVVNLTGPEGHSGRLIKKKWKDLLLSVHHKLKDPDSMTAEEKRVFDMFSDIDEPDKFLKAAHRKRLRFQLGQKDRFLDGLYHSGRYLPYMEEIFRREGMPVELTRLPFVESSFNIHARSKVGASGIWQFMRSTAKLFIRVSDDALDERNDPIRATEAAAKLLRLNYDSLGSWPLAVTAYNHGRKGMMRAVRRVGSEELEELVSGYHSRSFGFASSNFFPELLAAIEVEKNADKYFGHLDRAKPDVFVEAKIPDYIDIRELSSFLKLDMAALKDLNPGLTDSVFKGERLLPAGYRLRFPHDGQVSPDGAVRIFMAGYTQIPNIYKLRSQSRTIVRRAHSRRRRPSSG